MKRKIYLAVLLASTLTRLTGAVLASADHIDPTLRKMLARVIRATSPYQDVAVAEAAWYVSTVECVAVPGLGGMGVHYVKFGLLGDLSLNPTKPEVLLYEPRRGGFGLVGVEYVMMALANSPAGPIPWFDPAPPADGWYTSNPEIFGQTLNGPMPGHGPGEPWHYELHAWVWKTNPNAVFSDLNPAVSCP